jgi:hypothetical protein
MGEDFAQRILGFALAPPGIRLQFDMEFADMRPPGVLAYAGAADLLLDRGDVR